MHDLAGRHFCVSFAEPRDVALAHRIGQSVMLDNGAFTAWTQGREVDWDEWALWADEWLAYPTTWAVAPDVIDGSEEDNNDLLNRYWAWPKVAPVWHLHESLGRLMWLRTKYDRICFGSSGAYRTIGTPEWHHRICEAFNAIADNRGRVGWVHMLRGMSLSGSEYPFASADSTDIARNHHQPYQNVRAMADRWDSRQCPPVWSLREQLRLQEEPA
jgi:hypothetical protein